MVLDCRRGPLKLLVDGPPRRVTMMLSAFHSGKGSAERCSNPGQALVDTWLALARLQAHTIVLVGAVALHGDWWQLLDHLLVKIASAGAD